MSLPHSDFPLGTDNQVATGATAALLIMAKAPLPGAVKTRLEPALGREAAAALAAAMLRRSLETARQFAESHCHVELQLWGQPAPDSAAWDAVSMPAGIALETQCQGDLGDRMGLALSAALTRFDKALIIGSDCPALSGETFAWAFAALDSVDCCVVPSLDGGYVLLGLRRFDAGIFRDMPWSTPALMDASRRRLAELGFSLAEHAPMMDIDTPEDLPFLQGSELEVFISPAAGGKMRRDPCGDPSLGS